jgi:uncharacterized membrane protein YhaH (DUF805 family)
MVIPITLCWIRANRPIGRCDQWEVIPLGRATMSWVRMFLGFSGRVDRERYVRACRILSLACFLPAVLLYRSDITVSIVAVFLPASWPFLALAVKRLRDSGRSAEFAVPLMGAWLFAGGSLLAGADMVITAGLTTLAAFGFAIAVFAKLQDKIGKFPSGGLALR